MKKRLVTASAFHYGHLAYKHAGATVDGFRQVRGITQQELADRLSYSREAIAAKVHARRRLSFDDISRLSQVLGVSPSLLLPPSWNDYRSE